MPSLQVVDLGENVDTGMGGFARNLLGTLHQKSEQRRNDELFNRIAEKYSGDNANPVQMLMDVIRGEGLDPEYKQNKIKDLIEYGTLAAKNKLNGYEQTKLDLRNEELAARQEANRIAALRAQNEADKTKNAGDKNKKNQPKEVAAYIKNLIKDSDFDAEDIADINQYALEQINDEENPIDLAKAAGIAIQFKNMQKDLIDEAPFVEKPSKGFLGIGGSNTTYDEAFAQAEQQLQKLHDEDGITSQKNLKRIAKRGGWNDEEIRKMLENVFRRNNKALKGRAPKKQEANASPEKTAEIPFQQQGVASEAAGIDDILWGD